MLSTICEAAEITNRESRQDPEANVAALQNLQSYSYATSTNAKAAGFSAITPSGTRKYSQHLEDYEDLGEIGRGQFGSVHKVRLKTDPSVVLVWKKLDYQRMPEKEKKQLQQEVQLLQTLEHPHVVRYLGKINDKTSSHIYLLMEYCDGGDLSKYLDHTVRKGFPLPEDTILLWFSQLVDALHYCHTLPSGRVFHRDIKPQNVLICEKYKKVKLGDFGLAKMLKPQQIMAHTHVGTPYYMSPEVLNRSHYDAKSDIWSLGCLLFEMATGRSPHCKATTLEHLKSLVESGHIDKLPAIFSKELYSLILWMLTKNATQRPSTADLRGTFAFRLGCFIGLGELTAKVDTRRRLLDKENKHLKASLEEEKEARITERNNFEEEIKRLKSQVASMKSVSHHSRFLSTNSQVLGVHPKRIFVSSPNHASSWTLNPIPGNTRSVTSTFGGQSISTSTGGDSSLPASEQEVASPRLNSRDNHDYLVRWERLGRVSRNMLVDTSWPDDAATRPSSQPVYSRSKSRCGTGRSTSSHIEGKSSFSAREMESRRLSFAPPSVPVIETPKKMSNQSRQPLISNSGTPLFSQANSSLFRRRTHKCVDQFIEDISFYEAPPFHPPPHRRSPFSTPLRRAERLVERLPTRLSAPDSHFDNSVGRMGNFCPGSGENRPRSMAGFLKNVGSCAQKRSSPSQFSHVYK